MTENLNDLRKVAEAATPGPWRIENDSEQDYEAGIPYSEWPPTLIGPKNTQCSQWVKDNGGEFMVDEIQELTFADAEFIATFDPPAVLALIERLERAEQRVARVREVIRQYDPDRLTCMCNSDGDCCKCTVADFQEALDGEPNE